MKGFRGGEAAITPRQLQPRDLRLRARDLNEGVDSDERASAEACSVQEMDAERRNGF
jgi:hypothetical protein